MKLIKITLYTALSLILCILSTGSMIIAAPSSIGCTLQYSKNSTLSPLTVIYGGTQPIITIHEIGIPKITFELGKSSDQWHFDLLITATKIAYQLKQFPNQEEIQNTVDYLKIDPQTSYKYYSLDFNNGVWEITEQTLPESGQIPDRAIIIECYPEWIQEIKGGSAVELPTIYLNNALADLGASEEDFKEALVKLELTALDSKITHSPMRRKTQTISDKKRILIMDLIT
jgi:hypothetical protein